MAEEKRVRVVFEAVGGSQAAADAARFKTELGGIADAEDKASDGSEALRAELARLSGQVSALQQAQQRGAQTQQTATQAQAAASAKAIELTTKLAGAASAVQGLTAAMGVQGGTAGLIAATAASTAAGAQMGAMFGPQGALVGGILGFAIPALQSLATAHETATEAANRQRGAIDQLRQSMLAQRLEADVQGALSDPSMGAAILGALPEDTILQQRDLAAIQARELDRDRSRLERSRQRDGLRRDDTTLPQIEEELSGARQRMAMLDAELERRRALASATRDQAEIEAGLRAAAVEQARGARAANDTREDLDYEEQARLATLDLLEQQIDATMRAKAAEEERIASAIAGYAEWKGAQEQQLEAYLANVAQATAANDASQEEFARSSLERERRWSAQRTAALDRETEKREQELSVFGELAGGVSRSLVTAVSAIASGAQTAEEAFKGMLASFLTSIAEQALISAMREYAEAIGAFARYDFGGGAGHVAAGLAFTGVAIATGAAAGAVSAPPSQQQAASPDRAGSTGGGDGGRTVFVNNWNAPQVVAGTEADVGRTLGRLGRRSVQRFGRLAA